MPGILNFSMQYSQVYVRDKDLILTLNSFYGKTSAHDCGLIAFSIYELSSRNLILALYQSYKWGKTLNKCWLG